MSSCDTRHDRWKSRHRPIQPAACLGDTTRKVRTLSIDLTWDAAVRAVWTGRELQAQKQVDAGKTDAGTRGAVTGGKHLEPMQEAVAELFRNAEGITFDILSSGKLTLPGYYRRTKDWDLVVLYRGVLVAAVEFKSQVGSFGNNFNNRTEEAIGNAADVWRAYQENYLGPIKPWLAFVIHPIPPGPCVRAESLTRQ